MERGTSMRIHRMSLIVSYVSGFIHDEISFGMCIEYLELSAFIV